jgi:hypothetical protein
MHVVFLLHDEANRLARTAQDRLVFLRHNVSRKMRHRDILGVTLKLMSIGMLLQCAVPRTFPSDAEMATEGVCIQIGARSASASCMSRATYDPIVGCRPGAPSCRTKTRPRRADDA